MDMNAPLKISFFPLTRPYQKEKGWLVSKKKISSSKKINEFQNMRKIYHNHLNVQNSA